MSLPIVVAYPLRLLVLPVLLLAACAAPQRAPEPAPVVVQLPPPPRLRTRSVCRRTGSSLIQP